MSYEFKKLSEVEALTEVPEGANMIAEVNGEIKRVPAATGSGLTVINLTFDVKSNTLTSDLTGNQIMALVKEGKQCVFYDGCSYSSFIDDFGDAVISANNIGNADVFSVYYDMVKVDAYSTNVTRIPVVNTPYILADDRKVYKLSIGTGGTITATEVTDSSVIGQ